MPDGGVPYPLLVLTGLLRGSCSPPLFPGPATAWSATRTLISKVYFPRLIVPLSALAVALVDMAILLVLTLADCRRLRVAPDCGCSCCRSSSWPRWF